MFEAPKSKYLVPFDGSFRVADAPTNPAKGKWRSKSRLTTAIEELDGLQKALYAHDRHAILLVFQAMDAGGKDSTIRAVMEGINPAGCQVFSFKKPSSRDLDHDFLWRTACSLPERGRIGIFNRSHYEEVLVVRVHPELLRAQKLPDSIDMESIWEERFESIADFEKHLARNGTVIVKFWLNVSREEQKARFLSRLDVPEKQWKFNAGDIHERQFWDQYMEAYEDVLNATSRPWAPWYAIPADSKPYARACVAEIIVEALGSIGLEYPQPTAEDRATFDAAREELSGK
jgi:PPK2 family polyphosphate:nucleotide phosphotransferase